MNSAKNSQEYPEFVPEPETTFMEDMAYLSQAFNKLPTDSKVILSIFLGIIVVGVLNGIMDKI